MSHNERINKITEEIKALEKERSWLNRKAREESSAKIKSVPFEFSYEIITADTNHDEEGSFRILRRLDNYQVYQDIIEKYGYPTFTGIEEHKSVLSVSYIRKNGNIVTHNGGGYLVLNDPFICEDDEWNLLLKGDRKTIEKFLK